MIAIVSGTVAVRRPSSVVVDCGGVGYVLSVSSETLAAVPGVGQDVLLHSHLVVRDDSMQLYGFATEEERELFLLLLSVPSVGPKVALAVLGSAPVASLMSGIAAGDAARLQSVPGIGKRTAERICLDLRDAAGASVLATAVPGEVEGTRETARAGLIGLGLDEREVDGLLDAAEGETAEALIQSALRQVGR